MIVVYAKPTQSVFPDLPQTILLRAEDLPPPATAARFL